MTFAILCNEPNTDKKVLGTIWANEESQANALASALWSTSGSSSFVLRKVSEDREIPLQLQHG